MTLKRKTATDGVCENCSETFSKRAAPGHLHKCWELEKGRGKIPLDKKTFLIKVESADMPQLYWMYIWVSYQTNLYAIDRFLRDIWLECCEHLSLFTIFDRDYFSTRDEDTADVKEDMDVEIGELVGKGDVFCYEYDLGSTTDLVLQVVALVSMEMMEPVILAMMNEEPVFICDQCDKVAQLICTFCSAKACKKCRKKEPCAKHQGDDYMLTELVNSPRTGVCDYS